MTGPIRVARVEELPPGAGKLVQVGAREIAVYNLDGRFYAAASGGRLRTPDQASTDCTLGGARFDAAADDSPRRLGRTLATVERGFVVVYVED